MCTCVCIKREVEIKRKKRKKQSLLTSSRAATVCRHWDMRETNVDVVGELMSSRLSSTNSATLINPGMMTTVLDEAQEGDNEERASLDCLRHNSLLVSAQGELYCYSPPPSFVRSFVRLCQPAAPGKRYTNTRICCCCCFFAGLLILDSYYGVGFWSVGRCLFVVRLRLSLWFYFLPIGCYSE